MIERHFISKTNAQITVKVVIYTCGLVKKKKYAFSKVSQYAWVLNTQMSDFHTKGLSFLPCARGYFTWF